MIKWLDDYELCDGHEDGDRWYCPAWGDYLEGTYRCCVCTPTRYHSLNVLRAVLRRIVAKVKG